MHRYRCSEGAHGCGRRFTLRRAPHQYCRGPFCPHCKTIHVRSVERAAKAQTKRRKASGLICRCGHYPFPHVRGTLRFCREHERAHVDYSNAEYRAYQLVLETPRGAWCGGG